MARKLSEKDKPLTKKQKEAYEERAIIIDGDMLPPDHEKVKEAHAEMRALEQGYVNLKVSELSEEIEKRKEAITEKIVEYANKHMEIVRDSDGNVISRKMKIVATNMGEYVINRMFFSSICPLSSKEPAYNAEKLAIVFDLYEDIVMKVNENICQMIPSKSHFCRFAGITTATYNGYKQSEDPDMQVVMGKIEDMLLDVHMTMAENYKTNTNAMKYRMNVEMDKRENYNPQVVIKADIKDLDDYKNRISALGEIEYEVGDEHYEVLEDGDDNE